MGWGPCFSCGQATNTASLTLLTALLLACWTPGVRAQAVNIQVRVENVTNWVSVPGGTNHFPETNVIRFMQWPHRGKGRPFETILLKPGDVSTNTIVKTCEKINQVGLVEQHIITTVNGVTSIRTNCVCLDVLPQRLITNR